MEISMKEKIKMNQIMKERDRFRNEKNQLEAQIKIDGLTRLFNRSYFNSLVCAMHKKPACINNRYRGSRCGLF